MKADMKTGAKMIADERRRQVKEEGWSADHDHGHQDLELVVAAYCYLGGYIERHHAAHEPDVPEEWPWERRWWKPKNATRDLVRAGALIAAELDRLNDGDGLIRTPDSATTEDTEDTEGLVERAPEVVRRCDDWLRSYKGDTGGHLSVPSMEHLRDTIRALLAHLRTSGAAREPDGLRLIDEAPRDRTVVWVESKDPHEGGFLASWSTGYSIHGLGGHWYPIEHGLGHYGDLHLKGWRMPTMDDLEDLWERLTTPPSEEEGDE